MVVEVEKLKETKVVQRIVKNWSKDILVHKMMTKKFVIEIYV
jgi:hypothetical protein